MRTRQLLLIPLVLLGLAGQAWAQPAAKGPDQTQILTVSNTAVGLSTAMLTANGNQATACVFTVLTDDIRLRYDGTAPTDLIGHLYEAPAAFQVSGNSSLRALRLIRVTTDATVTITCSYGPNEPALRATGGGGGGGGGVSATVAISQTGTDNDVDAVLSVGTLDDGLIDLDSGAGTVNRVSYGILGAASGGPVGIEGTTANGLEVDVTRVTGNVAVTCALCATDAKLDTIITHVDTLETIFGTDTILGTAGTADTDVLSVQGIASMTPLQVSGAQTPSDNLANPTTAINVMSFQMCWDGATWDRCTGAGVDTELPAAAALADNTANPTVPAVGAFLMCWDGATWDRCPIGAGGAGTIDANTSRVNIATDDPVNDALVNLDSALNADEGAFSYTTTQTLAFGAVAESTSDAIADGLQGAVNMTLDRKLWVQPRGYLAGGAVPVTMKSDNTNNDDETAICTGPCTIYSITAFNHAAASAFLRCENDTTGNTTPGSETAADGEPDFEIPGNAAGAGFHVEWPIGISFSTALTCWIATGEASSDAVDAALDDVTVLISRVQ